MKAKIKKKILFIVLICAGVISIGIITVHFSNQHLSKSELAQLRKQYPIYGPTISQELIDAFGKEAYIEQYHEKTENFIYGEIVGEYTTFWKDGYVISAFDEKNLSYKVYSGIKVEELLEKVKVYLK